MVITDFFAVTKFGTENPLPIILKYSPKIPVQFTISRKIYIYYPLLYFGFWLKWKLKSVLPFWWTRF